MRLDSEKHLFGIQLRSSPNLDSGHENLLLEGYLEFGEKGVPQNGFRRRVAPAIPVARDSQSFQVTWVDHWGPARIQAPGPDGIRDCCVRILMSRCWLSDYPSVSI